MLSDDEDDKAFAGELGGSVPRRRRRREQGGVETSRSVAPAARRRGLHAHEPLRDARVLQADRVPGAHRGVPRRGQREAQERRVRGKRDPAARIVVWTRPPKARNAESDAARSRRSASTGTTLWCFCTGSGSASRRTGYVCALPDAARSSRRSGRTSPTAGTTARTSTRAPRKSQPSSSARRAAPRRTRWRDLRGVDATQDAIVRRARDVRCDVIAHSYGTVCLTAFRRHYQSRCVSWRASTRCASSSFGSYLRYGFDHHLSGWRALFAHLSARANGRASP